MRLRNRAANEGNAKLSGLTLEAAIILVAHRPAVLQQCRIMFVLPFLKYFKPFLGRIAWAICCMMIVGALSAAPILIGSKAINIFQTLGIGNPEDLGELAGVSSKFVKPRVIHFISEKPRKHSPGAKANDFLERQLGRAWTGPRGWVVEQVRSVQAFSLTWNTLYGLKAIQSPFEILIFYAILIVVLTAVKGLAEFSSKFQLAYTFFLTNLQIREDIFGNVLRQDYLYFNVHSPGYLHSRINSDVKSIRDILEGMLSEGVQQPITILAMFGVLIYLNATLTMYVMLILPLTGGLLYYMARVLRKNTAKQKKKEDQLSSSLTESLSNIRLVKAFGTEDIEIGKFHERTLALFRYIIARRMAKFGSSPMMEFFGSIAVSGILIGGGWMILDPKSNMLFGDFAMYLFTLTRFYRPLRSLATLTNKYQDARVSAERMSEMLALRPQIHERADARPFSDVSQGIEFRNVGFAYDDKRILEGVSITVRAGERVALAGPSGGGKTTLVNMLARLFDPTEGAILIDGVDLRELSVNDWRTHLAIVTQDTFLFDDTIESNIAYGMGTPDPERVQAAAKAANAHEFIMNLDGGLGYQTRIGTAGGKLSGGQRQRLAIARAIYRNPKILILDEATSALDAQSQAIVQEALNRLMAGRTTFVIAHRISTIRDMDCIYVIDAGRIVEQGSHDRLMEIDGGLYRAMVTKVGLVSEESTVDETALMALRSRSTEWADERDPALEGL